MNTNTAFLIVLMTFTMTVSAQEEETYEAAEVTAPSFYERFLPGNWWTWDR